MSRRSIEKSARKRANRERRALPEVEKLRGLCRINALELKEYPDGKITVLGGLMPVHWWPASRRRTAYVDGAPQGYPDVGPHEIVNLAAKGERA